MPGDVKFAYFTSEGNMSEITVDELTKGKKVGSLHVAVRLFPAQLARESWQS